MKTALVLSEFLFGVAFIALAIWLGSIVAADRTPRGEHTPTYVGMAGFGAFLSVCIGGFCLIGGFIDLERFADEEDKT